MVSTPDYQDLEEEVESWEHPYEVYGHHDGVNQLVISILGLFNFTHYFLPTQNIKETFLANNLQIVAMTGYRTM